MESYDEFSQQARLQRLLAKYAEDIEDGHSLTRLEKIRQEINAVVRNLQYEGLAVAHLYISKEEAYFRYLQPVNEDIVYSPARLFNLVWRYEDEMEDRYPFPYLEELREKINLLATHQLHRGIISKEQDPRISTAEARRRYKKCRNPFVDIEMFLFIRKMGFGKYI